MLLESILSTPGIPSSVVERTTTLLIGESISQDSSERVAPSRTLLSIVQQRHPHIFQQTAKAERDTGEELQVEIDQLILSVSLVRSNEHDDKVKLKANLSLPRFPPKNLQTGMKQKRFLRLLVLIPTSE